MVKQFLQEWDFFGMPIIQIMNARLRFEQETLLISDPMPFAAQLHLSQIRSRKTVFSLTSCRAPSPSPTNRNPHKNPAPIRASFPENPPKMIGITNRLDQSLYGDRNISSHYNDQRIHRTPEIEGKGTCRRLYCKSWRRIPQGFAIEPCSCGYHVVHCSIRR